MTLSLLLRPSTAPEETALRALLEHLLQAGDPERLVETLVDLYGKVSRENDRLRQRIFQLTHRIHGRSSEKIDPNALRKALEEIRLPRPKKPAKARKPLPGHLSREERRHVLPEADRICEYCQQPKRPIREEVAERLAHKDFPVP